MSGPEPLRIRCEHCSCAVHPDEAVNIESLDENVCPRCFDNWTTDQAEAYQERLNEDFHDGGSTRFPDAERVRMEAARKLK